MKRNILTALGCLFWSYPLALAIRDLWRFGIYEENFGFNYDLLPLLGIPAGMIGLTLGLSHLAKNGTVFGSLIASSALAFIAALLWVGIWGQSV